MKLDENKIDDAVLALLHLTTFQDSPGYRTWTGHDWDALGRLHEKGWISNPKGKAKSVSLSDEGFERSRELFEQLFTSDN